MTRLKEIEEILRGIDDEETQSEDGWWETEAGADFGKQRLDLIRELFKQDEKQ